METEHLVIIKKMESRYLDAIRQGLLIKEEIQIGFEFHKAYVGRVIVTVPKRLSMAKRRIALNYIEGFELALDAMNGAVPEVWSPYYS